MLLRWRFWDCLFVCRLFFISWMTFAVRDVLKAVARELVQVHKHRSQFGLHQSPRMSLFTCRWSLLFWRHLDDTPTECDSSSLAPRPCVFQVSIGDVFAWQECLFFSSYARLQPRLQEGTSVQLSVWCSVLSWQSACPYRASASFLRLSEPCLASLSCSIELFATTSGLSLRRFLGFLDCDRTPVASERHQKPTTSCSWLLAARRATHTHS